MPISHRPWPLPVTSIDTFSYANLALDETLEELASRFIFNIPEWERNSMERVGFQVESAHWHYEDFVREQNPKFPSCTLKRFFGMLWSAVPLLNEWHEMHEEAFDQFMAYKAFVPVCGAIILNDACDKCVLVKGWKNSAGWGFPKGKINQNEETMACAIREVLEETGFDIKPYASEERSISVSIYSQQITLYIIHPVSEAVVFETRTRKEISRIEWFKLADLPGWGPNRSPAKFFLIHPFMQELKQWVIQYKRALQLRVANEQAALAQASSPAPKKGKKNKDKARNVKQGGRSQNVSIDAGSRRQNGGDFTLEGQINPSGPDDSFADLSGDMPDLTASKTASTSGDFSLAEFIAAANKGDEYPAVVTASAVSSGANQPYFGQFASPPLIRSHTDTSHVASPFTRNQVRSNSHSSISSASSSLSPSQGGNKEDVSQRARDLLDLFAGDAVRHTTSVHSSEQTPRPRPLTMPLHSDFSIMPPMPRSMPSHNGAALMAALQMQPLSPRARVSGVQNSPSTASSATSHSFGSFSNFAPSGHVIGSAPSGMGDAGGAINPPGSISSTSSSSRGHINHPQPVQFTGTPSLSHPVESYPYRPSSVPVQEINTHAPHFSPMHTVGGGNHPNNPYEQPAHYPLLTRPSNINPSAGIAPAASAPRHVPHAHQLLALFSDAPVDSNRG